MTELTIAVEKAPDARDLPLPSYATPGSAGLDLRANVPGDVLLKPLERRAIPTGIRIAIPEGFEGQVRPRSGLALQHGIGMVNAPGTIDSDYRGEIQVILINWSEEPQTIRRGQRIAQLVIAPTARAELIEVDMMEDTARGSGGFGHTGT